MPKAIERITAGESIPFSFDRGGASISGWACTITLKKKKGDTAVLSRVITPTDEVWEGFLTTDETSGLALGTWYLTASMINATTNEMEQKTAVFGVTRAWTP